MFLNWIYNNDPLVVTVAFVILSLMVSSLVLLLAYAVTKEGTRGAHGELASFVVTNVAVLYAVLLAFIAIATWESYSKAADIVDREANLAANLFRDTRGLPQPLAGHLRAEVKGYLRTVINQEWPAQQSGKVPSAGWASLDRIHDDIASLAPDNPGQTVLMQEMLRGLNELYDARSTRLEAVEGHIPPMIWFVILVLGALVVGYTCFVRSEGLLAHMAMLWGLTASLALIVALIVELDYPFRGQISVSTGSYALVLRQLGASNPPAEQ